VFALSHASILHRLRSMFISSFIQFVVLQTESAALSAYLIAK
jgi:hypothetical protein